MGNKTPTPTHEQAVPALPTEGEVRKAFHELSFICPATRTDGALAPKLDLDGPIYPGWAATRDANRSPSSVRVATAVELATYNDIIQDKGEEAARQWLNKEWTSG